ncbi:MAG: hypothetical protein EBX41_02175 [Chitinophagia bacterium]|nr:hypothetical protein [Chitinophagia bacterium]
MLNACNNAIRHRTDATDAFSQQIVFAEKIYELGHRKEALAYIDSVYKNFKGITVEDRVNYFAYINMIYDNAFNNHTISNQLGDSMLYYLNKAPNYPKKQVRIVQAYNTKADGNVATKHFSEAFENYTKAQSIARQNKDSCSMAAYSHSIGMVLYRQKKYVSAANYFKLSYEQAGNCEDVFTYFYLKQELLDNIGLCYSKLHINDSALKYYYKALDYIRSKKKTDFKKSEYVYLMAEAIVIGNLADIYIDSNKYDSAIALLNRSIAVNLQKGYTNSDALLSQVKLGNIYATINDTTKLSQLIHAIDVELDSIPLPEVKINNEKLKWKYYELKHDTQKAYFHLEQYYGKKEAYDASDKQLMEKDINAHISDLEHQNELNAVQIEKDRQQNTIYTIIFICICFLIIIIFIAVYAKAKTDNVTNLVALNNTIEEQNKTLEQTLDKLEARDKERSRILRSVAHDVMSPISAVSALADLLLLDEDSITEDQKESIGLIKEACTNSLTLSKDIIEAARSMENETPVMELEDIGKLVENSVNLLKIRALEKKQTILLISHPEQLMATVNKDKIWRAINNLIVNAIKFSYENSEIVVKIAVQSPFIVISIKDSGIGIPQKNLTSIFDMFTESRVYGTKGEKPHGIGLSISIQTAKAHGGTIWVESEEGKGSTFYFSFLQNASKNIN